MIHKRLDINSLGSVIGYFPEPGTNLASKTSDPSITSDKLMNKRVLSVLILLTSFAALTQTASASVAVPESASSAALLGFAVVGLAAFRGFLRK